MSIFSRLFNQGTSPSGNAPDAGKGEAGGETDASTTRLVASTDQSVEGAPAADVDEVIEEIGDAEIDAALEVAAESARPFTEDEQPTDPAPAPEMEPPAPASTIGDAVARVASPSGEMPAVTTKGGSSTGTYMFAAPRERGPRPSPRPSGSHHAVRPQAPALDGPPRPPSRAAMEAVRATAAQASAPSTPSPQGPPSPPPVPRKSPSRTMTAMGVAPPSRTDIEAAKAKAALEAAVAAAPAESPPSTEAPPVTSPPLRRPSRELALSLDPSPRFRAAAEEPARVLRQTMIAVREGDASPGWVGDAAPALEALLGTAEGLGMTSLSAALEELGRLLPKSGDTTGVLDAETASRLLERHASLVALAPDLFDLEPDMDRRDDVVVAAFAEQAAGGGPGVYAKLRAARFHRLRALEGGVSVQDLCTATGLGEDAARRVLQRVELFTRDRAASRREPGGDHLRQRLMALTARLRVQHEEFERLGEGWADGDETQRKQRRQARADTYLNVKVLLAAMGELERVATLERRPFQRRVEELESFLDEIMTDGEADQEDGA